MSGNAAKWEAGDAERGECRNKWQDLRVGRNTRDKAERGELLSPTPVKSLLLVVSNSDFSFSDICP